MEFGEITKQRYAAKKFDGRMVPEGKMEELYEMIRLSASSFNLQPWKFKVVTDQKVKDRIMEVSWGQPQVGTCSHLIVMCADTEVGKLIDRLEKSLSKTDMPSESVQAYVKMMRGFAEGMGEEQKLAWAQKQVYIALGNALNGAKALGLDSCPMEGFDAKKCAEILGLPSNIVPTLLCPVGYAADKPRGKMRFAKEDVFF